MPSRRPRPRITAVLTIFVAFQAAGPAWAWGRWGHRLVANLAERRLSPEARAAVAALPEPGESLADCSTWADEQKRRIGASVRRRPCLTWLAA